MQLYKCIIIITNINSNTFSDMHDCRGTLKFVNIKSTTINISALISTFLWCCLYVIKYVYKAVSAFACFIFSQGIPDFDENTPQY